MGNLYYGGGGGGCGVGGDLSAYPGAIHRGGNWSWTIDPETGEEVGEYTETIYYPDRKEQTVTPFRRPARSE